MSVDKSTVKINSINLYDHEYYGPLIDSYIKSILKSGLLLDEDLEVLLSVSKFRNFPERSGYRPPITLFASIISVLGSSFLAKKLEMNFLVIPPVIISAHLALREYRNEKRKRDNNKLMDVLLNILNKIQRLNKNVAKYMKTRCDLGKAISQSSLPLYGKNLEEFMNSFLPYSCTMFEFIINNLKTLASYLPELQEDLIILEHLNFPSIVVCENPDDAESCLIRIQKIYDINVLIFSKLLSYIGTLLSSQTLKESSARYLIDEVLPKIVKVLHQYHDTIRKEFASLRYSAKQKSEIKLECGKPSKISTKLEAALISSVNNLSVILEKSQTILDKLDSDSEKSITEIGDAIVDLRNHTFATYESLDLLCRLYGILSNSTNTVPTNCSIPVSKVNDVAPDTAPTVNYDDATEPIEEKFELYIGVDDCVDERPKVDYEDQSSAYLSLMLQELKESLKQHKRFVEAKSKRGDEDEEEEIEKTHIGKERRPKFNLEELRSTEKQSLLDVDRKLVVSDMPAPKPPPLPSFSLGSLEEESGQVNARSMLDNIKALSTQRNIQEDVFGDSDKDSNSSG